jgi:hypothetical protein
LIPGRPDRTKQNRQIKNPETRFDSTETERALALRPAKSSAKERKQPAFVGPASADTGFKTYRG